ncbi:2-oxoglutarate-dependent dioxygenase family protein putative isoform 1 [Tripterygium wilfordii]|uniref:DNA N(6)-methyladenine demethylase n=1 Tax=Tripterygium wilfordii TaxID=458696 RepID=A0A7J7CD88_TRIWF|nr:uncharacterized protein LOC119984647 [Tripterygium wilfordii]KAF5732099.1 2-oxoglutarate-dependent dioxygenase family protein putative isoform 1 [Tripterygium wilfordii]
MSNRGRPRSVGAYSGRGLRGVASTPPGGRRSAHHHVPVEEDDSLANISPVPGDRMAQGRGKVTQQKSAVYRSQHSRHKPTPVYVYRPKLPSPGVDDELPNEIKLQKETDDPEVGNISSNQSNDPLASNSVDKDDHAIMTLEAFDICPPKPAASMTLKSSLFEKNKERQIEDKRFREGKKGNVLRSGTVLLENYLSLEEQVKEDDSHANISPVPGDGMAQGRGKVTQQKSGIYRSQHSRHKPTPVCVYRPKLSSPGVDDELPNEIKLQKEMDAPEAGNTSSNISKDPLASDSVDKDDHAIMTLEAFDICPPKPAALMTLKASLFEKNKEIRNEKKRFLEGEKRTVLRSGMVLLKNYLSLEEQVKIVKACQKLGLGPGGFYQPGYRDGAQLHLKMMCLGKIWDPETSKYGDRRPFDNAEPPSIPNEFHQLVEKAIKDSHALIKGESEASNVEDILPGMKPDICIVNFYSASGRLGLHQDRDESRESLAKRLPVVSFSIGDSGEFLYGDQPDAEKAKKVVLKSGDVLLFGGTSRHIFHGVTSIFSESAPKMLLEETNLRRGRLNLTFREY